MHKVIILILMTDLGLLASAKNMGIRFMGCNALPPMMPWLLIRSTPPWRWVDSGHKINSEKGKLRVEKPE